LESDFVFDKDKNKYYLQLQIETRQKIRILYPDPMEWWKNIPSFDQENLHVVFGHYSKSLESNNYLAKNPHLLNGIITIISHIKKAGTRCGCGEIRKGSLEKNYLRLVSISLDHLPQLKTFNPSPLIKSGFLEHSELEPNQYYLVVPHPSFSEIIEGNNQLVNTEK